MSFEEFLRWAQSVGIEAIIGFVMSFVVEWWPAYNDLAPRAKRVGFFVLCLAIPSLAALLGATLGYQLMNFEETFWPALVAGFAAFSMGTMAHVRQLPT